MNCVLHPISCATGAAASASAGLFFSTLASWVAGATAWAWGLLGTVLTASSSPRVIVRASATEYGHLLGVAPLVALCAVLANVVRSLRLSDVSSLVQENLIAAPLLIIALVSAPSLASVVLNVTNALCSVAGSGATAEVSSLSSVVVAWPSAVPGFGVFLLSSVEIVAALLLLFELVVRDALLALILALSPLLAAAAIFAPLRRVAVRAVETFVALSLAKVVVVVALGIGASAVTSGQLFVILTGVAVVLIAVLTPFVLLRLVPFLESSTVHAAEGLRQRASSSTRRVVSLASGAVGGEIPVEPPVRPEDWGLEDWPGSGPLEFPDQSGPPPRPPIGEPRGRTGHPVWTRDEHGPQLGWHFDE